MLNVFKNWTNKEFDGTLFLGGILFAFLLVIVLTFANRDFAGLSSTDKIIDIIADMLIFMAGYIFKSAVQNALKKNDEDKT